MQPNHWNRSYDSLGVKQLTDRSNGNVKNWKLFLHIYILTCDCRIKLIDWHLDGDFYSSRDDRIYSTNYCTTLVKLFIPYRFTVNPTLCNLLVLYNCHVQPLQLKNRSRLRLTGVQESGCCHTDRYNLSHCSFLIKYIIHVPKRGVTERLYPLLLQSTNECNCLPVLAL